MVNVLIVEDSRVISEYLYYILSKDPQIQVIGNVSNGKQAIEFLDENKPDVIFNMTIYSLVGPKSGISLTEVYRLIDNRITKVSHRSSDLDAKKKTLRKEAQYMAGWYKSITNDMFN